MPWSLVGEITPSYDEIRLPNPVSGHTALRITQTYNGGSIGNGSCHLAEIYGYDYHYLPIIYPRVNAYVIDLPVIPAFLEAGIFVRIISVRMRIRSRILEGSNWKIKIEDFI